MSCDLRDPCTECGAGPCPTTTYCYEKQEALRRREEELDQPCPYCAKPLVYVEARQQFECPECGYIESYTEPDAETAEEQFRWATGGVR